MGVGIGEDVRAELEPLANAALDAPGTAAQLAEAIMVLAEHVTQLEQRLHGLERDSKASERSGLFEH